MNKYAIDNEVYYNGVPYIVIDYSSVGSYYFYDLEEVNGDGICNDIPEDMIESVDKYNKYDVPYHCYRIVFFDGKYRDVDVGDEDDWGNIQPCLPEDECCKDDWDKAIGFGNDSDGHKKIIRVIDLEDGSEWIGNNAIKTWYEDCVAEFSDNYSS